MPRESGQGERERKERERVTERGAPGLIRYWLIAKNEIDRMEVLTVDHGGEDVMPVFSFPEEAEAFLGLGGFGGEWGIKESRAGELAWLLLVPYAHVGRVAFDPLPRTVDFVSLDREAFVRHLAGGRELRRYRGKEIPDGTTEDFAIPDYVLRDFGFGEGRE